MCALYYIYFIALAIKYIHNYHIVINKIYFPLEIGIVEEGGDAPVGFKELKLSSWLSLRICANYLIFLYFGSVFGTNPG